MYGREAYDASVEATEWVLELPFPPEGPPDSLCQRAASDKPELWPAHVPKAVRCNVQTNASLIRHAGEAAKPANLNDVRLSADAAGLRAATPLALTSRETGPAPKRGTGSCHPQLGG